MLSAIAHDYTSGYMMAIRDWTRRRSVITQTKCRDINLQQAYGVCTRVHVSHHSRPSPTQTAMPCFRQYIAVYTTPFIFNVSLSLYLPLNLISNPCDSSIIHHILPAPHAFYAHCNIPPVAPQHATVQPQPTHTHTQLPPLASPSTDRSPLPKFGRYANAPRVRRHDGVQCRCRCSAVQVQCRAMRCDAMRCNAMSAPSRAALHPLQTESVTVVAWHRVVRATIFEWPYRVIDEHRETVIFRAVYRSQSPTLNMFKDITSKLVSIAL